jgi:hypothetical protein
MKIKSNRDKAEAVARSRLKQTKGISQCRLNDRFAQ